jgi:phosphoesterase RecJ-like protein
MGAAEVLAALRQKGRILVAAHVNPDGDAVGATSAMGWLLRSMGKQFTLYNATGIPRHLEWLDFPAPLVTRLAPPPFDFDCIVALDSGDPRRLGDELCAVFEAFPSLNLDHHADNPGYGSLGNLVDASMASTGQIVAALADAAGIPLTGGLAEGVYVSLIADTGSFSFGNTTPETLELTARMMRLGLDVASLRARYDSQWTLAKAELWGRLLQSIRLEDEGRVALVEARLEDFARTGARPSDLEQFVELLRCVVGARVALLVREDAPDMHKISLRSRGEDDVRCVAAAFGGGGHRNAAGATVAAPREKLVPLVLEAIRDTLAKSGEKA